MASKRKPSPNRPENDPRAMRRAVREFKRDKEQRRRDRSWRNADAEDWFESDWKDFERVMPRGERERRRTVTTVSSAEVAHPDEEFAEEGLAGLVLAQNSGFYQVEVGDEVLSCRLRGRLVGADLNSTPVAVGDQVTVQPIEDGTGLIVAVAPRETSLSRPDPFLAHREHVIVANIDQLIIVQAVRDPLFWHEMVDRYLVAASAWGVSPLLVINKADLGSEAEVAELVALYERLNVPLLVTSAVEGRGIDELRERLAGHMSAVAGLSGVGKSSLLQAVEPALDLRISEISDWRPEGRHTTTEITLHPLHFGGYVADTPGVRGFGLWNIEPDEVALYFPEMVALLGACRFRDCSHRDEIGCAIQAAVEAGTIAETRYKSYLAMREEAGSTPAW